MERITITPDFILNVLIPLLNKTVETVYESQRAMYEAYMIPNSVREMNIRSAERWYMSTLDAFIQLTEDLG